MMAKRSRKVATIDYKAEISALFPQAVFEHRFAAPRRWRFDVAFLNERIALECHGGVFTRGRHTRGAGFIADMEKANVATMMGWRLLCFTPGNRKRFSDLMSNLALMLEGTVWDVVPATHRDPPKRRKRLTALRVRAKKRT